MLFWGQFGASFTKFRRNSLCSFASADGLVKRQAKQKAIWHVVRFAQ